MKHYIWYVFLANTTSLDCMYVYVLICMCMYNVCICLYVYSLLQKMSKYDIFVCVCMMLYMIVCLLYVSVSWCMIVWYHLLQCCCALSEGQECFQHRAITWWMSKYDIFVCVCMMLYMIVCLLYVSVSWCMIVWYHLLQCCCALSEGQ